MTPLTKIRAKEIMETDLVVLSRSAPIEEAIRTLEEYAISGAPVVDDAGEVVGVLSLSDIARSEHVRDDRLEGRATSYYVASDLDETSVGGAGEEFLQEDYGPEVTGRKVVADWMTPQMIAVGPEASLKEVCQVMSRENIHRVLVLDGKKLSGILSSFDIVRFLAGPG